MVEFLKEVLVLVLGRGFVILVFHLEHNRDDLVAARVALTEDEVTLGALGCIVVFLKIRVGKRRHAQAIELGLAVLLERLAHHLGGQAHLHILEALNLFVLVADQLIARALCLGKLELVRRLGLLLTRIAHRKLAREFRARLIALTLRRGNRLRQVHFCRQLLLTQLGAQTLCLLLGLSLCGGELLLHLRLIVGKRALGFAASRSELALRLSRGSGKRHLLSFVRRRELRLQLGNLGIACGQVVLSGIAHRGLGKLGFVVLASQLRTQVVNLALELSILLLSIGTGLNSRTLACALALCGSALELGAQLGKLGVALGNFLRQLLSRGVFLLNKLSVALGLRLLQGRRRTRTLKLQRLLAFALDSLHTFVKVMRKFSITHLFDDVRIAGRIDLKDFAAMRALDLVHSSSSMDANFNRLHSTAPCGQKRHRRQNGNGAKTTTKVSVPIVVV